MLKMLQGGIPSTSRSGELEVMDPEYQLSEFLKDSADMDFVLGSNLQAVEQLTGTKFLTGIN